MKSVFTLLARDLRGGELSILVFSLILATATVTSINLFTNRIQNSILDEATEFLAADAQVRSTLPIPNELKQQAQQHKLISAEINTFRAMAFSESGMQLVAVKGVTQNYPLKGAVTLSDTAFGTGKFTTHGPAEGEVWLASRLFGALQIAIGDTISIGDATLTVTQALIKEPDSPQTFFGVAPRALINIADIPKTGAVQTGSRVNYALLLVGETDGLEVIKKLSNAEDSPHTRWVGVEQSNQNIGDALARAEKFLLLAGSLSVLLSGVAIAMAARRYAARQSNTVALLKTFGQTPANILWRNLIVLSIIGLGTVITGAISGWLLHLLILKLLANLLPDALASASLGAYFGGALAGIIALLAFAAPPLLALKNIAPARVLRESDSGALFNPKLAAAIGLSAILLLIFGYSASLSMTLTIAIACTVVVIGGSVLAWSMLRLGKHFVANWGTHWRLGFANLQRHQGFNAVQIMIFATLIMLLLILTEMRTGLIKQWQNQLPKDAPNHFIFNIFNDEKPQIENLLQEHNIDHKPFYPMLRGRIIEVNGESVKPRIETTKSHMNYERELNLTWASTLGDDNKIVEGRWHGEHSPVDLTVSSEQEYAEGIGLKVGDSLTFSIAGQTVTARLGSIRSVQWDSMNPNFFMIFSQPLLNNTATNWLTSLYLPADQKQFLNSLSRQFPTASIVELDQMIDQVRSIMSKVSLAVEFILVLVLAAGLLVLITSIQATLDVRFQESAILRTLGAPRRLVNKVLIIEFGALGFMAGLLAAMGAQLALYYLQTELFELPFEGSLLVWMAGPLGGSLLIGIIGWISTRKVTLQPPLTTLRNL